MNKEDLEKAPLEFLQNKEKGARGLFYVFIPLTLLLVFFTIRDIVVDDHYDYSMITISLCTLAGMWFAYADWKKVKDVLANRS